MNLFRKLFGLDFPDPAVGQVWQSQHSGNSFRVERVEISDAGYVHVSVQYQRRDDPSWNPMPTEYTSALWQWRACLREERRVLVGVGQPPFPIHRPPRPGAWPAPPPVSSTALRRERKIGMDDEITITRADLTQALRKWELDARTGKTMTREESAAMAIDVVAEASADVLWPLLRERVPV